MNINVMNQVIILALMMMVGVILRKTKTITDEVNKSFSNILINVTMPCMIIYSFNFKFSMDMLKGASMILFYSILIHIILIISSKLLYSKFENSKKNVFIFATVFSNCGFVGYPVIQGIFGNIGVFYTSIYTIPFNIFMWSYGVILFTGKSDLKSIKKNLINIPLICTLLGIIIFLFSIKLPSPLLKTLGSIGNMTTPLSMFIVGSMLADVKLKDVFRGFDIYYVNFVKLIVAPLITYFVLNLLGASKTLLYICVILVAMPTASLIAVLAEKYSGDKVTASKCAFLTTILSIITIPVIMSVIDFFIK
ncbi:AEC family transporter [Clostridium estertheticum]|uniref:AEC family transporter n=1 Tax=Clostridium estertheticum TaxID=238834 RepID=UPI001C7D41B6|nr:AEC family transporter [Clostridium estertheticum]MBX4259502.1 AEC family transporter [Clostridium estertheticum]WLC70798.1 AEC family transporter [Clostridium estertheticum]